MAEKPTVAIIGGGCSGALAALHLLRGLRPVRIHLIESRATAGLGLAYSTACADHLLNVPACRMSVSSATPLDFVDWLRDHVDTSVDPDVFAPRALYGRYVSDRLQDACRTAGPEVSFSRHHAEVLNVSRHAHHAMLHLSGGQWLAADFVVLALGNAAPRRLPFFPDGARAPRFYDSAWHPGALTDTEPNSPVVLVGSGLTAVDAFLGLRAHGHRGTVYAISRRGLLPHAHGSFSTNTSAAHIWEPGTLRELVRELRTRVREAQGAGADWRPVIDSLRPETNHLWLCLSSRDRERFYRHVKVYWDVHRHRMPRQVALLIEHSRRSGNLQVHSGRIQCISEGPTNVIVEVLLRSQKPIRLRASRVINCTGPEQDYRRVDSHLLRALFQKGWLAVNRPQIGLQTTGNGMVLDHHGSVIPWLYAIGPMRIGSLLETTAVPEIREQAAALAETLLGAVVGAPRLGNRMLVEASR